MTTLPTPRLTATLTHHADERLARVVIEAPAESAWRRLMRLLARAAWGSAVSLRPRSTVRRPVKLKAFDFSGLTSCDFCGGGCSDPTCERCYPPPDPRDAEVRAWRGVWSEVAP